MSRSGLELILIKCVQAFCEAVLNRYEQLLLLTQEFYTVPGQYLSKHGN